MREVHAGVITGAMPRVNAQVINAPRITEGMGDPDAPDLRIEQRRYHVLLRRFVDECRGNESAAARRLGTKQPNVYGILHGAKQPGPKLIEAARKKLRLRKAYFYDDGPIDWDYELFQEGTRVERDEELGPGPVEDFIAAKALLGEPVDEAHKRELRRMRQALGPDVMTLDVVKTTHARLVALDAGRAIEPPSVPIEIDTEAGQRPITPIKPRKGR
ncbi:MAG TPA: hypothetical protein VFT98_03605 [Myxococcota bacterium]|nr:hypothetical protein [Myxococcota bacterium]